MFIKHLLILVCLICIDGLEARYPSVDVSKYVVTDDDPKVLISCFYDQKNFIENMKLILNGKKYSVYSEFIYDDPYGEFI